MHFRLTFTNVYLIQKNLVPGSAFRTDHIHIIPSHVESRVQVMVPMSEMRGTRDVNNQQIPTEEVIFVIWPASPLCILYKVIFFKNNKIEENLSGGKEARSQ